MSNEAKDYEAIAIEIMLAWSDFSDETRANIVENLRAHFPPQSESAQDEERNCVICINRGKCCATCGAYSNFEPATSAPSESSLEEIIHSCDLCDWYRKDGSCDCPDHIPDHCKPYECPGWTLNKCIKTSSDLKSAIDLDPETNLSKPSGEEILRLVAETIIAPHDDDLEGFAVQLYFEDVLSLPEVYGTETIISALAALRSRAPQPEPGQDAKALWARLVKISTSGTRTSIPINATTEIERYGQHQYNVGYAVAVKNLAAPRPAAAALRDFAEDVLGWAEAYPTKVFTEPEPEKVRIVCESLGCTLDAIAAMVLRAFTKPWAEKSRAALAVSPEPSSAEKGEG
jgi:hypothetical protein